MRTILVTLLSWLMISIPLYAQKSLVLSKPDDPIADVSEKVLSEAYQRIGIQIQMITLPAERALLTSNSGDVDGEVNRIKGIEKIYLNLMMVPVVINMLEGVVFTKDVSIHVTKWNSLKPYKIGIRRGTKFAERGTKGMDVDFVTTNMQLLSKLDMGRCDVIVTSRLEGLDQIKQLHLTGIYILEPPLVRLKLYHYLHKKHITLLPDITNVLQKMEEEGRIQAIRQTVYK